MINLRIRTEYSFRSSYGKIKDVIAGQDEYAAMTDKGNTFGHIPFWNECKKQGKKAILGVELAFVENAILKVRTNAFHVTLLAKNRKGLAKIYQLVSLSTKQKYYFNRLSFEELRSIGEDVIVIIQDSFLQKYLKGRSNTYYGVSPTTVYSDFNKNKLPVVALSDNLFNTQDEKELYEIIIGAKHESRVELSHVLDEDEWKQEIRFEAKEAIDNTYKIAEQIEQFDFERAELPESQIEDNLLQLCLKCDTRNLLTGDYLKRLNHEIKIIEDKKFEDYFFLVYNLVKYAKEHMLVGPARGSSAGSLVCYILGITEVDPIKHDLLFTRFIDPNRSDLPDIDIDFQDTKREMLLGYLKDKYGDDCVAKLGTVSKYKAKSTLGETSKVMGIPQWEMETLKDSIIEKSTGNQLDEVFKSSIGKDYLEKHPGLEFAKHIEGHSRHFGQHAAAIVVSSKPLENYCSLDQSFDGCQLDKNDAENVNLLKMDCLGLRTLTVIQDCLDLIGKNRQWLVDYPLDDQAAFDIINTKRFSGIFQFEGSSLISVSKKINIKNFNDVSAITSLARPGTLMNGEADRYIKHKNTDTYNYLHPFLEPILKETFGIIVYQEQVMKIVKQIGNFSWEDTSRIRKAIGKSMGSAYIDEMRGSFIFGCTQNGIDGNIAQAIWSNILDMGSYTFNKSHAVAYSMLSYWCMVLKNYYPLEFALATLKNAKDDAQVVKTLKELVIEGYEYLPFDAELSEVDWSIKDGKLIGGFTNIKGVGKVKAGKYVSKRKSGKELTSAESVALFNAETPFDCLFEFKDKFPNFYKKWDLFLHHKPILLKDIEEESMEVKFIAKAKSVTIRDINDAKSLKKRDGERKEKGPFKFLDITFADDTDEIDCRIKEKFYPKINVKEGEYYLVSGSSCNGFRYIMINNVKRITPQEVIDKINEKSI